MQQELKELQPELIETSKETEQLIKIIADETLEVEDKKQVKNMNAVITEMITHLNYLKGAQGQRKQQ